jgi:hypothetical protein
LKTLGLVAGLLFLAANAGFAAPAPQLAPCTSSLTVGRTDINGTDLTTIVGDSANIRARVTSTCQVQTVVAEAFGHQVTLTFDSLLASWVGNLSLAGDPHVAFALTVSATDVNGAVASRNVSLIHDTPPSLTVTSPTPSTVARPMLRLAVECSDDGPSGCAQVSVNIVKVDNRDVTPAILASGLTQIDDTVSLLAYEGQQLEIEFIGFDSGQGQEPHPQITRIRRLVYVDSSPRLVEQTHSPGAIVDDSPARTLFLGDDRYPTVIEKGTGLIVPLTTPNVNDTSDISDLNAQGRVTDRGAIVITHADGDRVFEYRDGQVSIVSLQLAAALHVSGNYAVWQSWAGSGISVFRRDLRDGATVSIADPGAHSADVASNGDVVYWSSGNGAVFRDRNGLTTQLTAAFGMGDKPLTDGLNVAYERYPNTLQLITDAGEITLTIEDRGLTARKDYALNAGWTGFTVQSGADTNVWRRTPDGLTAQVSFFGGESRIDAVNTDGALTVHNAGRLWLIAPDGAVTDIAPSFGQPMYTRSYWRNGELFVITGASVFKVDLPYTAPNQPPSLINPGNRTNVAGTAIAPLQLQGADPYGEPVSYTASGLPAGLTLQQSTGLITGTATTPGVFAVTATVRDGAVPALVDAKTFTWTITSPEPSITLTPDSAPVGSPLTIVLTNGSGNRNDWVGLYETSAPDGTFLKWQYLNGLMTLPMSGVTGATLQFAAPVMPGTYNVRLFRNGYDRLAMSSVVTVPAPTITPVAVTVNPGALISFTVAGGPGNRNDWVGLYETSAPDGTFLKWQYLNGLMTLPMSGVTGATLQFAAPVMPGTYNVRLFRNGYDRLAMSSVVTVPAPTVTTAAATVNPGATISFTVAGGPGNAARLDGTVSQS